MIFLSTIATLRDMPRPSTIKIKRNGERRSPCRIPWEGEKVVEGEPLTRIEKKKENEGQDPFDLDRGETKTSKDMVDVLLDKLVKGLRHV
jgi:hypothetical protein